MPAEENEKVEDSPFPTSWGLSEQGRRSRAGLLIPLGETEAETLVRGQGPVEEAED